MLLLCLHKYTIHLYTPSPHSYSYSYIYMNSDGFAPLITSGCRCTLGISPRPIARRIALAILRWFFGRRPVSLECLIRPVSFMNSDIIVKFCVRQRWRPRLRLGSSVHTLYSFTGLIPSTSNASLCGFLRPSFHFFISVPLRSCGAYTSPGCQRR